MPGDGQNRQMRQEVKDDEEEHRSRHPPPPGAHQITEPRMASRISGASMMKLTRVARLVTPANQKLRALTRRHFNSSSGWLL